MTTEPTYQEKLARHEAAYRALAAAFAALAGFDDVVQVNLARRNLNARLTETQEAIEYYRPFAADEAAQPLAASAATSTADDDAQRGIDDEKGDAGYSHCVHCDRFTVQVFDGKDWICEACGWAITQPAPAPVPAAKATRLTKAQRTALETISTAVEVWHHWSRFDSEAWLVKPSGYVYGDEFGRLTGVTVKKLIDLKLVTTEQKRDWNYVSITDAGREALK